MPRSPERSSTPTSPALLGAFAALLAGCATGTAPPAAPAAAAAAAATTVAANPATAASAPRPAAAPPRPPAAPGTPPAFAEVTKDAKSSEGFLTVWTKDEKTWLEIPAERLDQPFFFGASLASGLGERFFWPGLMGAEQIVVLRRVGNNVQLVARNLKARAPAGTPLAQALSESYSRQPAQRRAAGRGGAPGPQIAAGGRERAARRRHHRHTDVARGGPTGCRTRWTAPTHRSNAPAAAPRARR